MKGFQVLKVKGENDFRDSPFLISEEQFMSFINRHKHLSPIYETNDLFQGSYVMFDPLGRFFQNSKGHIEYSRFILDVDPLEALAEVGWDKERFIREILEIQKISIISIKDKHSKTFRFAELGRLLELCEEKNVLDSNLLEILNYFLLDTGENVRNDVAHGNIVADLNVKHNSLFGFLLSMFLIFFYFKEKNDSNSV